MPAEQSFVVQRSVPVGPATKLADIVCFLTLIIAAVTAFVPSEPAGDGGSGDSQLPVPGCPQCLTVGDQKLAAQLKMEAIKRQILTKLSLNAKPNITSPLPREVILEVLKRSPGYVGHGGKGSHGGGPFDQGPNMDFAGDESRREDDYYARTSEIIAFAEPGATLNGHNLLDLHPPHAFPHRLRVSGATLWIQLRYAPNLSPEIQNSVRNRSVTLYALRVTANETSPSTATLSSTAVYSSTSTSHSPLKFELVGSQKVSLAHIGWKKINMTLEIQRWFSSLPSRKLTLLVDCSGCESIVELDLFGGAHPPLNYESRGWHPGNHNFAEFTNNRRIRHHNNRSQPPLTDYGPFLTINTEPIRRRRNKRHIINCNPYITTCCKQSLYVTFKELGWDDWIIAPKGYHANYCMGDCAKSPRTPDTFATFHKHVLEEYRSRNPYASIAPCCAPTRLSSMSLIYFDTELNIIKTDLPKMIVEECGCT